MSDVTRHWARRFELAASELPGASLPWLAASRREALDHFVARGFPTRRDEDWRWTDVSSLAERSYDAATASVRLAGGGPGVRVRPLAEALAEDPQRLESVMGRALDAKASGFAALNAALFDGGAVVEIDAGAVVEAPIEVSVEHDGDGAACTRLLVLAGENSRATLVERWSGRGRYLANGATEVYVAPGAQLSHARVQQESLQADHVASLAVRQDRGSRYGSWAVAQGGRIARLDVNVTLEAEGAECELLGLYMGRERQLVDHHTAIDHAMPHTNSRQLYKGILDGRARGVFRGRVHVRPQAQKIDARQTNRSLLLSDDAVANTKPQLEIYADDVKCSHGATIGRLSEEAIFYLRSRGISLPHARRLLTVAFAREILADLPVAELRGELEERTARWIESSDAEESTR